MDAVDANVRFGAALDPSTCFAMREEACATSDVAHSSAHKSESVTACAKQTVTLVNSFRSGTLRGAQCTACINSTFQSRPVPWHTSHDSAPPVDVCTEM